MNSIAQAQGGWTFGWWGVSARAATPARNRMAEQVPRDALTPWAPMGLMTLQYSLPRPACSQCGFPGPAPWCPSDTPQMRFRDSDPHPCPAGLAITGGQDFGSACLPRALCFEPGWVPPRETAQSGPARGNVICFSSQFALFSF